MIRIRSESPEETEALAARLAERLEPGDVVAVAGQLGSGKTTFVRGACRALGVTQPVTSPTYTIGNRYAGRVAVSHLDLYRLPTITDADWAGLEPYLEGSVTFVEWPPHTGSRLPAPRVTVRLSHAGPSGRVIEVESGEGDLLAGLL